jgi:hypothetical protein
MVHCGPGARTPVDDWEITQLLPEVLLLLLLEEAQIGGKSVLKASDI